MTEPPDLMTCARTAAKRAYCPYSRFHVGAAVRLADGSVHVGCNVESASYGLTICAERSAVFAAVAGSGGTPQIVAVAVACPDLADGFGPAQSMPCGACRQVLAEFAAPGCVVEVDRVGALPLADLLPQAFRLTEES